MAHRWKFTTHLPSDRRMLRRFRDAGKGRPRCSGVKCSPRCHTERRPNEGARRMPGNAWKSPVRAGLASLLASKASCRSPRQD
jgi:hypothetical protein